MEASGHSGLVSWSIIKLAALFTPRRALKVGHSITPVALCPLSLSLSLSFILHTRVLHIDINRRRLVTVLTQPSLSFSLSLSLSLFFFVFLIDSSITFISSRSLRTSNNCLQRQRRRQKNQERRSSSWQPNPSGVEGCRWQ